jgi:hypothetical protein
MHTDHRPESTGVGSLTDGGDRPTVVSAFDELAMLTTTVTRSAGDDGAIVVHLDTTFEPDGSDGGPGLRVRINDDPVYEVVPHHAGDTSAVVAAPGSLPAAAGGADAIATVELSGGAVVADVTDIDGIAGLLGTELTTLRLVLHRDGVWLCTGGRTGASEYRRVWTPPHLCTGDDDS